LKAIDKDPRRRYQTAGELGADLRRFVNRFAIAARRPGPVERLGKWGRRHPGAAMALVVVVLATILVGFFSYRGPMAASQAEPDGVRHEEERRADKQRAALERTTLAAMAGKFDQAKRYLDDAIVLGVSPGDILLWRGQIARHRGDMQEALEDLEKAA